MRTTFTVTETYTVKATTIDQVREMVEANDFDVDSDVSTPKITIEPNI
jgi:hypothetical protein